MQRKDYHGGTEARRRGRRPTASPCLCVSVVEIPVFFAALCLQAAAARAEEVFADVTEKAGIRFQHVNGAVGKKHLYETMIGGAGWLDYDGDGLLDLYLVQGHGDSDRAFFP